MKEKPILYRLMPSDPAGHRFSVSLTVPEPAPDGQMLALPAECQSMAELALIGNALPALRH